jgi:hypothetical protein
MLGRGTHGPPPQVLDLERGTFVMLGYGSITRVRILHLEEMVPGGSLIFSGGCGTGPNSLVTACLRVISSQMPGTPYEENSLTGALRFCHARSCSRHPRGFCARAPLGELAITSTRLHSINYVVRTTTFCGLFFACISFNLPSVTGPIAW